MKLATTVKRKSSFWNIVPAYKKTAQALYPNIYLPSHMYDNLHSSHPKKEYIALLRHEQTHLQRQKHAGVIRWLFRYLFSPSFRFAEELEAIKTSMHYSKKMHLKFDTTRQAAYLSGPLYMFCTSFEAAKKKLNTAWK